MTMKVGGIIFFLVLGSLILTALGGLIDIFQTGGLSKEHLWHDSLILMLLAVVLVHAV
jgi:hypothetical protein